MSEGYKLAQKKMIQQQAREVQNIFLFPLIYVGGRCHHYSFNPWQESPHLN